MNKIAIMLLTVLTFGIFLASGAPLFADDCEQCVGRCLDAADSCKNLRPLA